MYVYSCNALSARFFAVDRTLNASFMIMITIISVFDLCRVQWYRIIHLERVRVLVRDRRTWSGVTRVSIIREARQTSPGANCSNGKAASTPGHRPAAATQDGHGREQIPDPLSTIVNDERCPSRLYRSRRSWEGDTVGASAPSRRGGGKIPYQPNLSPS